MLVNTITVMMKHFIEFIPKPKGDDQMMFSRRLWASLSVSETILNEIKLREMTFDALFSGAWPWQSSHTPASWPRLQSFLFFFYCVQPSLVENPPFTVWGRAVVWGLATHDKLSVPCALCNLFITVALLGSFQVFSLHSYEVHNYNSGRFTNQNCWPRPCSGFCVALNMDI